MPTKILMCHCTHKYQDARYGKQKRLHNFAPTGTPNNDEGWR
ncbi:hypothetical protein LCGC14_2526220, partial [marine sediment metagenome]